MSDHPPEPWHLAGDGLVTTWLVHRDRVPDLPPGARPVVVRGRVPVVTAFVRYDPSGVLAYRELLAAVVVRHGRGLALTVTDIWVDSAASRDGGWSLWGIPKELADFPTAPGTSGTAVPASAVVGGREAARASYRPGRLPTLPLPVPVVGRVVQEQDGGPVVTRVRARGRLRHVSAAWTVPADGPLGWLAGARPLAHLAAEGFALTFGPRLRP